MAPFDAKQIPHLYAENGLKRGLIFPNDIRPKNAKNTHLMCNVWTVREIRDQMLWVSTFRASHFPVRKDFSCFPNSPQELSANFRWRLRFLITSATSTRLNWRVMFSLKKPRFCGQIMRFRGAKSISDLIGRPRNSLSVARRNFRSNDKEEENAQFYRINFLKYLQKFYFIRLGK